MRLLKALLIAAVATTSVATVAILLNERSFISSADAAIARGTQFLLARQDPDGAFRTSSYGAMRDGFSLTPIALKTLAYLDQEEAARRAAAWLAAQDPSRAVLGYPVYTSALTIQGLAKLADPAHVSARKVWLDFLLTQQYTEQHGWKPEDPGYGGFGYGRPRPPAPGLPGAPANLSATLFALGAMRVSGMPATATAIQAAHRFVESCRTSDGGFVASPIDEVLVKTGDRTHAYGSATADGIRAQLLCGADATKSREWLIEHFDATTNPGDFAPQRIALRDGYYYYYAWSVAHALVRTGTSEPLKELAGELVRRQREDGSWRNDVTDGREDEPTVGTCLALGALVNCRAVISAR